MTLGRTLVVLSTEGRGAGRPIRPSCASPVTSTAAMSLMHATINTRANVGSAGGSSVGTPLTCTNTTSVSGLSDGGPVFVAVDHFEAWFDSVVMEKFRRPYLHSVLLPLKGNRVDCLIFTIGGAGATLSSHCFCRGV